MANDLSPQSEKRWQAEVSESGSVLQRSPRYSAIYTEKPAVLMKECEQDASTRLVSLKWRRASCHLLPNVQLSPELEP